MAEKTSIRKHLDSLGYSPMQTGLGALAKGLSTGMQQNIQNRILQQQLANQSQELAWKNPYRTPSQLDTLQASQNPIAQMMAMQGLDVAGLQAKLKPQTEAAQADLQAEAIAQNQQQQQQNAVNVPIIPWQQWSGDDFIAYQQEAKKRAAKKGV